MHNFASLDQLYHNPSFAIRYTFCMGRSIVITSGKGGVGKTTITASLGITLARKGNSVVVVDADVTLNNLDLVLGLENSVSYDIFDVINGKCRLKQALVSYPDADLKLLPSVRGDDIPERDFRTVMNEIRGISDYLLIDCPAGVDDGFRRAVSVAEESLIVTTPTPSAIRDADKVISVLNRLKMRRSSLIVNRVRGDLILDGTMLSPDEIARLLKIRLIGCVPEDDSALDYSGISATEHTRSIKMIAKYLTVGNGEIYDATEPYRGLWGGIKRLLRKV